jgi:hypothetical protein
LETPQARGTATKRINTAAKIFFIFPSHHC